MVSRIRQSNIITISAFAGMAVQVSGMAVAWHAYNLKNVAPFAMQNHLVSELGWAEHSPQATVFGMAIGIGSAFFIPVLLAMSSLLPVRRRRLALLLGGCSVMGGVGVGVFPVAQNILPHALAAFSFFIGWLLAVSLFTVALRRDPRWHALVMIGVICVILAFTFMVLSGMQAKELLQILKTGHRPGILWAAIIEWSVLASFYLWNIVATLLLARCGKPGERKGLNHKDLN